MSSKSRIMISGTDLCLFLPHRITSRSLDQDIPHSGASLGNPGIEDKIQPRVYATSDTYFIHRAIPLSS